MPWTLYLADGVTPLPTNLELTPLHLADAQDIILKNTGTTTITSIRAWMRVPEVAPAPGADPAAPLPVPPSRIISIGGTAVPVGTEADAVELLSAPLAPGAFLPGVQHVALPTITVGMTELTLATRVQEV